ncbi:MAG: Trk family potassium uptake protein [Halanaerobiales bacterium]|nr:Trk family potassium uptake protein [Halanaerobiales bacterium]
MGYLIVIVIGTILLSLPIATASGDETSLMDALFTATSATAVTGLIVVNTASHWTVFGKVIIMLLIQIGGFGFMTTSTLVMLLLGKRITLKERLVIQEEMNASNLKGLIDLVRYVVILTLFIEVLGAILLFFKFISMMSPVQAVFFGFFHSISAFNNAGFDLFGNSLVNFTTDWYVILVITGLFIIGGIGFAVIAEIYNCRQFRKFSLHTKVVLTISILLIVIGTIVILGLEYNNPDTLGPLSLSGKVAAAYFQGVTPRTAGFNSIPFSKMTRASIFFITILMFIGSSPGSTGGGVKTTTFGTLLFVLWAFTRNRDDVVIFQRRLSHMTIFKALVVVMIGILLIIAVVIVLTVTEEMEFLDLFFETVSAFGTVGLSTGITGNLSLIGRFLIILTMFVGRVGPMTLALAIGEQREKVSIRYPEEKMMIG